MSDAANLARRIAEHLLSASPALRDLAPELVSVEPGRVSIALQIRDTMVNGQGIAYGGTLFSLADSAAALTALSGNEKAVSQTASVQFLRAGGGSDRVVATAREIERSGRNSVIDVEVRGSDDSVLVLARIQFRYLPGQVIEE